MADIFISYKKEDFDLANRLVTELRNEGMSVWWDEGLTPKEAWDTTIEREITAAASVLVLWSPRSIASDWVKREAHFGQDHNKLVPVIVAETTIPLAFTLNQTVNLAAWDGNRENRQWRKLLTWIADIVASRPGDPGLTPAPGATPVNRFRDAIGYLASGDPIVDGALVNSSTPSGTAFRDRKETPVMRIVPKGSFLLGATPDDPDRASYETPQKRIDIPAPFAIGVFPVLVAEYQTTSGDAAGAPAPAAPPPARGWFPWRRAAAAAVMAGATPAANPAAPMTSVSFEDARAFVAALSAETHENYRIPSEAEWEYACRSGSRTRYHCGDTIDATRAVFGRGSGPVDAGSLPANAYGLYDMHGNVREWTADLWHDSYEITPLDGRPSLEGHSSMRVVRGGGWSDTPALLRSAARMRATESIRSGVIGFRVARSLA